MSRGFTCFTLVYTHGYPPATVEHPAGGVAQVLLPHDQRRGEPGHDQEVVDDDHHGDEHPEDAHGGNGRKDVRDKGKCGGGACQEHSAPGLPARGSYK
eukprot:312216-Prorocentrum_minimum.AAC.1